MAQNKKVVEKKRFVKEALSLAPHEWNHCYKQLNDILKNGANSARYLEGMVLILIDEIESRINGKSFNKIIEK
jgi:hypothetical protein